MEDQSHQIKMGQNQDNQQTVAEILPILEVVRIYQPAKFPAIPSMRSEDIARKLPWMEAGFNANTDFHI